MSIEAGEDGNLGFAPYLSWQTLALALLTVSWQDPTLEI